MAQDWTIEIYQDRTGRRPYSEWLESLDITVQARIGVRLDRVRRGNFGDHKHISDGVYELRMHFGKGYRVYFGRESHRIVLLLCGGDKKSQKQDVEKAKTYWKDYQKAQR